MNYKEAREYIESAQEKLGSDYSLRDVMELSRRMGYPQECVKVVHIAGTNGKGSVGNYISSILAKAGYRVGRYVSPAVLDYRERVQLVTGEQGMDRKIKSVFMSEEEVAEGISALCPVCEEMVSEGFGQPTAFEIETVLAFLLFVKWQVDIAVVECGLGGRLDATNILSKPLLCVFTSISLDHMKLLGSSVPEIAREKYGIIREGTTVVSKLQPECESILQRLCQEKKAGLCFMDEQWLLAGSFSVRETVFRYREKQYTLGQGGSYQLENAALALEAVWQLRKKGYHHITDEAITEGLYESRWRGRFEVVADKPFLLVDGAHNAEAAEKLRHSLENYFPGERFVFIMGMFRDKEYEKVIHTLLPLAQKVYAVKAPGERGLESGLLCESVKKQGMSPENVCDCGNMRCALTEALAENQNKKVIVCGSLSILHEVYDFADSCSL